MTVAAASVALPQALTRHRLRTLIAGSTATVAVLIVVAVYAFLPGGGVDRRTVLIVVAIQLAASLLVGLLPWPRLFAAGRGEPLLKAWSGLSLVLIALSVGVTGGGSSRLFLLYALTAVFFAAAYPLRWQLVFGVETIASYVVALLATGFHIATNALFLEIGVFVILAGLAAFLSHQLHVQLAGHLAAQAESEERAAELARAGLESERRALHDPLTGLANRVLFVDGLGEALVDPQRRNTPAAVILLDLDGFKEVKDSFGHANGDELLRLVGTRLADEIGAQGTVARMGADEFAVLLPEIDGPETAITLAAEMVRMFDEPFEIDGIVVGMEASAGISLYPQHGSQVGELLLRADAALDEAKKGRTGWEVYTGASDEGSPMRLALLGQLRHAIDARELLLHYQPMVDMRDGSLRGVEALVRWQHPERGLILPGEFVPFVEQTALIGALTREVLDQAAAQARVWLDAGVDIPIAVNLSVRNLHNEAFPAEVAAVLERHRVPASSLELELTESAIMTNPKRAGGVLAQLGEMGINLVLDDFGTGYSSLAYLTQLPVGQLKIDRSFVIGMEGEGGDDVIVRSVIDIGHHLGLEVVAEGIENDATWQRLVELGCDVGQGYHLRRPGPADAIGNWPAHASGIQRRRAKAA
jgi:diguanylate cyclase (GGDEF)-like protein